MTTEEEKGRSRESGGLWKVIRREPIGLLAVLIALASFVWSIHTERAENPALSVRNAGVRLDRSRADRNGGEVWKLDLFVYASNTGRRAVGLREKGRMVIMTDDQQPVLSAEGFLRNPEPGQDRYDLTIEGLSEKRLVLEVMAIVPREQLPRRELSQERIRELAGQPGVVYTTELAGPDGRVLDTRPSDFDVSATLTADQEEGALVVDPGAAFKPQQSTAGGRAETPSAAE